MQYYSPLKMRNAVKTNNVFFWSLINIGVVSVPLVLVSSIFGQSSSFLVAVLGMIAFVAVIVITAVHCIRERKEAIKKNEEIMSGVYFVGKDERLIISQANQDYVAYFNNINGLARRFGNPPGGAR